ncbi:MAG: CTP-dependent riboflavin kinase [Nanoarchaeota archaeon]|nr:CTP-dependent riboflavin kinase [Nanoarchaeota archaeon]
MKRGLLLYIAEKTGLFSELQTSTTRIAEALSVSQQSVSRLLIDLEKGGMIERKVSSGGLAIALKKKGRDQLQNEFTVLKRLFHPERKLKGKVVDGFGEGKYYIEKYKLKIKEAMGFTPFPGTLNIKTDRIKVKSFLMDVDPIKINGFATSDRSFGSIELYRVNVGGVAGAIIKPERTRHDDNVIEVIADVHLRKKMGLKENNVVELKK